MPNPFERHLKRWRFHLSKRMSEFVEPRRIDIANEAKSQVQLAGIQPACARNPALQGGKLIA